MMAANSASSSSYEVRISPLIDESTARMSRHTSMPLPSGRRASRIATSGRSAGARWAASTAEPDSPTTSMSPSAWSRSARPRRTTSWSSSRKTRIIRHLYPVRPRRRRAEVPGRRPTGGDGTCGPVRHGRVGTKVETDIRTGRTAAVATTTDALTEAAELARYAPSIHNSQPWLWRVRDGVLDLHLATDRVLSVTDPDARLATLSCGAALHHARTALAAEGLAVEVTRLPDPDDRTHLARLTVTGHRPVEPEAVRLVQTVRVRHTDRRPVTADPVDAVDLAAIVS